VARPLRVQDLLDHGSRVHLDPPGSAERAGWIALGSVEREEADEVNALASTEADHGARAQMVLYLVEHLGEFDGARATLTEMTATNPPQKVRRLASYCLRL